ncbi:phospholipase D-like domain-containing protein [Gemmatimonadota bacterium Y43]|uniref:phospholipase D-like domain-containing protein n=1 Tax=Gaopeijia maritima TaxID=3119007 RepID=UPI003287E3B3
MSGGESPPAPQRTLSLRDGVEVGRPVPGAREGFPLEAMHRVTGSARLEGNRIGLQFEGPSTFDRWIEAIDSAERFVHFENYILRDDRIGRVFRDALVAKARQGVPVRLVYDWMGCWATPRRYWKTFREAGVQVRAFNRPSVRDPLGVLQRDHRKLVCVDGTVAFVGGFCVGQEWAGSADQPPWRDTGVEIRGPAAAAATRAFGRIWAEMGDPVPRDLDVDPAAVEAVGTTPVWLIEGEPNRTRVFRTLSLIAAHARRRLWITDPYFVAPRPVSEALAAAASNGVDVRVLVPAHNNWPWVGSLSRGGYRFLLEHGVRLFEWQGAMIHAKTSVADGVWCRVGSSNLNAASLLGNWEIDVGVLDAELAGQLEGLFLADLASSVEIILPSVRPVAPERVRGEMDTPVTSLDPEGSVPERLVGELRQRTSGAKGGSTGWRIADFVRAGSIFGDALAGHRPLGREDRTVLGTVSIGALVLAALFAFVPQVAGWFLAFVLAWLGITGGARAFLAARRAREHDASLAASPSEPAPLPPPDSPSEHPDQ